MHAVPYGMQEGSQGGQWVNEVGFYCAGWLFASSRSEAIVLVRDIDSQVNIARIEKICTHLQATPYGKGNVDLAGLEVEIATAKYPQAFQWQPHFSSRAFLMVSWP